MERKRHIEVCSGSFERAYEIVAGDDNIQTWLDEEDDLIATEETVVSEDVLLRNWAPGAAFVLAPFRGFGNSALRCAFAFSLRKTSSVSSL